MKNSTADIRIWLFVSLLLLAPVAAQAVSPIENISARTAAGLIQENLSNPDFIILDIRTPREFDAGRIAGAVMLDFYSKTFVQDFQNLDRNNTYFIYCRSGNRSGQLMKAVGDLGFKKIYNLERGLVDWVGQGFELKSTK